MTEAEERVFLKDIKKLLKENADIAVALSKI
jgi:hypothetical protein